MLQENLKFDFSSENQNSSVRESVRELTSQANEIHQKALVASRRYLIAEADLLAALIEVDRHEVYRDLGFAYLTPYCEKHLGLSSDVAAVFVRVARKSREVPELQSAVIAGLSVTKAKTIASVLTKDNHAGWIQKARILSKEKLEKEIVKTQPLLEKSERARPVREDRTRLEFELSDKHLALQRRAQDLISQKLGKSASLEETQVRLLEEFLSRHDPVEKAKRAVQRKERRSSPTKKHERPPKQANKADRSRDRSEKTVARRSSIPSHVLHAVHLRDQGRCQEKLPDGSFCGGTRWVEIHHILEKSQGGPDTLENLVTLCSAHHRRRHSFDRKDFQSSADLQAMRIGSSGRAMSTPSVHAKVSCISDSL